MHGKMKKIRLFSLIVAAALLLSMMGMSTMAADTEEEAKASLADVVITQTLNGRKVNNGTHNYATAGDEVSITYEATLQMTDLMAMYLQSREGNLMDAKFVVHVNMDMERLEFAADAVTITFTSTFLKPQEDENYSSELIGYDAETGVFTYEITADKDWALAQQSFAIPMELIVYYDAGRGENGTAYSYQEVKKAYTREELAAMPLLYGYFTVEQWMAPIKATLAEMRVKAGVAATVTEDSSTWVTVYANGTVDGYYSYIGESAADSIAILLEYENPPAAPGKSYVTTVQFGNGEDITEWVSNTVSARLINQMPVPPAQPESPYLNSEDHFAYIIGYPDGMVHPEGNITRAEVATIFFRMLTDETRNQYWSKTNDYTDVAADDWYNNAISTLSNLGVIEGYPDGSFQPNGPITRAEFAAIAVRFFDVEGYTWTEDAFTDIAGHWANEYINEAYLLKLVNGYPDGTYLPQNNITRAEAMTIVNNTLRRAPVKEGLLPVYEMITWPDNADRTEWYYEAVQEATNSHEYTFDTELDGEEWTAPLPVRDWAAFEKAWSDANSASNPGEVVDND